jgi:hypothetical protein
VKFTCKFFRFVQANRGTPLGLGRERAPTRCRALQRDAMRRRRAAAVRRHTTADTRSLGVSPVCISTTRTSRPHLGRDPRATRRACARRGAVDPPAAPTRRGPPYRALTCRSLRREANMPRRARIGYKSPPLWFPPEHTAVRRPPLPSPS